MKLERLMSCGFAEAIGIKRASMSHIINGRNNVSLDVLLKILERFTYVNSDWLLFGKGEMLAENKLVQPQLFENTPEIPAEAPVVPEKPREMVVEKPQIVAKPATEERVMRLDNLSKNVSKIMIFYSDNTFETFIPEKARKNLL